MKPYKVFGDGYRLVRKFDKHITYSSEVRKSSSGTPLGKPIERIQINNLDLTHDRVGRDKLERFNPSCRKKQG